MNSSNTLAALVAHCRKLTRRRHIPDAELLRRFAGQRDTAAFEELLERYAPLVWGVCRRILHRDADCEDAFQATFLIMVRQAGTIDPRRPLGAWLHTIAVRTSAKAKTRGQRQRTQAAIPERTTVGDIADELGNRELFGVVDEEIARLPVLLRAPFVLCCLEGRTRDEAAAALGCSVVAIKSRLERSRNVLRQRLERRGFGLPAAFLVLALTGSQVRASLRTKAIQSVLGSAPPAVAALLPAGASLANKLTLTAVSFMMVGVLGFGAYHAMQARPPQESPAAAKGIAPQSPQSPIAEKPQPLLDRFGDPLPPGAVRRFGTLRFRHNIIINLAFTPDGKQLLAGSGRNPLSVFDPATGQRLREVGKNSANNIYGFAVSPDGKRVACCGFDVFVWDLESGRLIRELGCGRCRSVAFSPDGKRIAAVKEFEPIVVLVEVATGKHLGQWTIKQGKRWQFDLDSLAFSPDGKYLAGILRESREETDGSNMYKPVGAQIYLLDAANGTLVRKLGSANETMTDFTFQPGTGRLAGVGTDGILRFWDIETGKELLRLPAIKGGSYALRFTTDGRRCLAVYKSGSVAIVDARNGRELHRIEIGASVQPSVFALSPDCRTLAEAKFFSGTRVRVWDIATGVERLADSGHDGPADLSLSADGRTLISREKVGGMFQSGRGQTYHWDLRTGVGRRQLNAEKYKGERYSWNGIVQTVRGHNWQLTIDHEKLVMEVRGLKDSRLLRKVKMPTVIRAHALAPDGTHVAIAFQDARKTVFLWNPENEEAPRKLLGHPDACQQLRFTHDSKRLIAGAGTHNAYPSSTVWIWDVATAQVVRKLASNSAPGEMLLTADDRVLLTGGLHNDATVHAWDMETGRELARLADPALKMTTDARGGGGSLPAIGGLALSADERFLAVVSYWRNSASVSVWETSSWKLVRAFAPTQPMYYSSSMVFSRDGRSLFVAKSDSTILEWGVFGHLANGRRQPVGDTFNTDRLNTLWRMLIETPDKAWPAVWELLDHPAESVPYLIGKLAPVKPIEAKTVQRWLAQLDSESFAERDEANRQLRMLGEQTLPVLRQALQEKPSLETKKRVEGLIESLTRGPSAEQLRLLRALAVLEWCNSREGGEHLRRLADGDPAARITRAAMAARQRH